MGRLVLAWDGALGDDTACAARGVPQREKANRMSSSTSWRKAAPDLAAFVLGLAVARALGWSARDLVWSLWLSSLVLGYLTILATIAGGVWVGAGVLREPGFPPEQRGRARLLAGGVALFVLGFFSLHFCGFHAGHATFLSFFFPLPGVPAATFMDAFMNPFLLWRAVFRHLLVPYGLFLIPVLVAERRQYLAPLRAASENVARIRHALQGAGGRSTDVFKDPFKRPYANVVRMHLLIFFFAACHFLRVDSFGVYAVVYFVYFFPWRLLRKDEVAEA